MSITGNEKTIMEYVNGQIRAIYPGDINAPDKSEKFEEKYASMPFELAVAGRHYNGSHSVSWGKCDLPYEFEFQGAKEKTFGNGEYDSGNTDLSSRATDISKELVLTYFHKGYSLSAQVTYQFVKGTAIIRTFTRIINEGESDITLTHLSSGFFPGVIPGGLNKWYDPEKYKLNYCLSGWHAEGQWRKDSLSNLGLYNGSTYGINNSVLFTSVGTFSTTRYMPFAILEDEETDTAFVWQIENSTSWYYDIGYKGNAEDEKGSLFVECGTNDERHLGWVKKLKSGQEYVTSVVSFGAVKGGFDEAVEEMTCYRRNCLMPEPSWKGELPVSFNDYMNCLWGQPTDDRLIPLIDAASSAGAEMFCIDAGWFGDKEPPFKYALECGDWQESKDRFGDYKLQGILDYIKEKNMVPGIWLEMEVCGNKSELSKKDDSWFLMRNGVRVGGGARYFLDFSNPLVCEYMMDVIDGLYKRGVRFIKNDYNDDIGIGCEYPDSSSPCDGMHKFVMSFYSFIDDVRKKYPDLTLENCGSGAMREDYGILSRFHLQSSSDQVDYQRYPSIACGSLACVLPEQLGIWSYPYPIAINEYDKPETIQTPEYKKRMEDGEETIFNMVTGFCGTLYLSGHIDYADSKNTELIKEGVETYKKQRSFIRSCYPFWPLGLKGMEDEKSFLVQGLMSNDKSRALIAVWRRKGSDETLTIDMKKYFGENYTIEQLYPIKTEGYKWGLEKHGSGFTVKTDKTNSARLFEIKAV